MSIRYWFPADEELNGAAGVAITDEDGGFIAGTMKCFAGLAFAGVLAANTLAAQLPYADGWQVDERVAPSTLLVDESHFIPTVRLAPIAYQLFDDDSDFVAAPTVALDEGQWTVTVPALAKSAPQAVLDDDQYVGYLGSDEDGWLPPVLLSVTRPLAIRDDGEIGFSAAPIAIESYEWPAVQLVSAARAPLRAVTDDSDFVAPVLTTLVDDDCGWWPRVALAPLPFSRVFGDEGDFDLALELLAFDGRVLSEPLYDGTISSGMQFDGAIGITAQLDGQLTIYPA